MHAIFFSDGLRNHKRVSWGGTVWQTVHSVIYFKHIEAIRESKQRGTASWSRRSFNSLWSEDFANPTLAFPQLNASLFLRFTCRSQNKICILNYAAASIVQNVAVFFNSPLLFGLSTLEFLTENNKTGPLLLIHSFFLIVVDFLMSDGPFIFV